jgi:hypothetical protein
LLLLEVLSPEHLLVLALHLALAGCQQVGVGIAWQTAVACLLAALRSAQPLLAGS